MGRKSITVVSAEESADTRYFGSPTLSERTREMGRPHQRTLRLVSSRTTKRLREAEQILRYNANGTPARAIDIGDEEKREGYRERQNNR